MKYQVFRPWNRLSPEAREANQHLTRIEGADVLYFEREDERPLWFHNLEYETIMYNVHHHEYLETAAGFWRRGEFWVEQRTMDALIEG